MANYITNTCGLIGSEPINKQGTLTKQARSQGILPLSLYYYPVNSDSTDQLSSRLDGILSGISFGDNIILQLPTMLGDQYDQALLSKINIFRQSSDSKLILAVHSVESDRSRVSELVKNYYNRADVLILPSVHYGNYLQEMGLTVRQLVYLTVYDQFGDDIIYPVPMMTNHIVTDTDSSQIVTSMEQNGYSVTNVANSKLSMLEERVLINHSGGWGIIWPTNDQERFNLKMTPTRFFNQLMLSGLPVIVQHDNALARLVSNHNLGIVVEGLSDAMAAIKNMTDQEYQNKVKSVHAISRLLANGVFTNQALSDALLLADLTKLGGQE